MVSARDHVVWIVGRPPGHSLAALAATLGIGRIDVAATGVFMIPGLAPDGDMYDARTVCLHRTVCDINVG